MLLFQLWATMLLMRKDDHVDLGETKANLIASNSILNFQLIRSSYLAGSGFLQGLRPNERTSFLCWSMCFFCQLKNPSGQLADWYLWGNWIRGYAWFLFSLKKSRGPSIKGLTSRSFATLDVGQKLGLSWLKDAPWLRAHKEDFVWDHLLVEAEKSLSAS